VAKKKKLSKKQIVKAHKAAKEILKSGRKGIDNAYAVATAAVKKGAKKKKAARKK